MYPLDRTTVRIANTRGIGTMSQTNESRPPTAATVMPLADAIAANLRDGDTVALEGFTHLIPFAAGHEVIRQGREELTLTRLTPDILYDQMIGMGCASKMVFSYGGNPGVGSLHRMRDAVEKGWPRPLELVEHSHAGMANAYVAGAAGLPLGLLRGYAGTDLAARAASVVEFVTCPFTGERLTAVRAINPDLAVIHAQQADRRGNVMLWGLSGVQKEAVLAARRAIATVEELVDELEPRPHAVVLPSWVLTAVCVVPGGSWPSYAAGYSTRDNDFYSEWDEIARDRERFTAWIRENVLDADRDAAMAARTVSTTA
jgi:glutaconate CoA-transferase, subunit A